jgi:hypothetical protein
MPVSSVSAAAASTTASATSQVASSAPAQATATSNVATPHHKKHRPAVGQPGHQVSKTA